MLNTRNILWKHFVCPMLRKTFTVTAEKETKHIAARRHRNKPPSEKFSDFSSSCIYL
jgi:hypothetical protein